LCRTWGSGRKSGWRVEGGRVAPPPFTAHPPPSSHRRFRWERTRGRCFMRCTPWRVAAGRTGCRSSEPWHPGKAADEDARLCARARAAIETALRRWAALTFRPLARQRGDVPRNGAREARYAFLARTAKRLRADAIATATPRTQAETVLLKLLAAPAPPASRAFPPRRIAGVRLVRPILQRDATRGAGLS